MIRQSNSYQKLLDIRKIVELTDSKSLIGLVSSISKRSFQTCFRLQYSFLFSEIERVKFLIDFSKTFRSSVNGNVD